MKNIPFDRPAYLLVESLLARRQQIEQAQARLNSDVEETCRFLEKVLNLEVGSIGSKYLLTVEGLIEQQEAPPPPLPDEIESGDDEESIPESPSVS